MLFEFFSIQIEIENICFSNSGLCPYKSLKMICLTLPCFDTFELDSRRLAVFSANFDVKLEALYEFTIRF